MTHYRDDLDAARSRIDTLEAKLRERDAAVDAREAELAEMRAEIARLRGRPDETGMAAWDRGQPAGGRVLLLALVASTFVTAAGYAMTRGQCYDAEGSARRYMPIPMRLDVPVSRKVPRPAEPPTVRPAEEQSASPQTREPRSQDR